MKKIIALALSLIMLLGCVSALAEAAEKETITMLGFSIKVDKLPEEYKIYIIRNSEIEYIANLIPSDGSKPILSMSMDFSDEWDGVNSLADATEEDMQAVKDSFYEVLELDDGDVTFEDRLVGEGMPILIARGVDGCFASVYAIYKSHEIELVIYPGEDGGSVSEEDISRAADFMTDILTQLASAE